MQINFSKGFYALFIWLLYNATLYAAAPAVKSEADSARFVQLEIDGAIGPASSDYFNRNLDLAIESGASGVLLRMDTPGGLDTSMRDIIKKIIASPIPVITYVAPGGARAASAGTYIVLASHVAAMAPGTNLGAATPVQLLGPVKAPKNSPQQHEEEDTAEKKVTSPVSPDAMQHKVVNDAVAYIRGLANLHGRNAEWAEQAVRSAASIPAQQALANNVIDIIAPNEQNLMTQLNNRQIKVLGEKLTLHTDNAVIDKVRPDWRSQLLAVITNPNVAYILMLAGVYGLIFEFSNPGAIVPGTIGGICLLLALFAFQVLPVNYAGMALILLGIALMVGEAFMPSFGVLGIGGVAAFIIGSIILMDTDAPGFGINYALIGGFAISSVIFIFLALGMLFKSRRKPVVSGREQLIGQVGYAMQDFSETGMIFIRSENWQARTDQALSKNEKARVTGLQGLTLLVTPLHKKEQG